jgi:UDP-glucose 4-epimerase
MQILITGGAGYIGSHLALVAKEKNIVPIIFDNLSTSQKPDIHLGELIVGDVRDRSALVSAFKFNHISAVVHLAGTSNVDSAALDPKSCFDNNVNGLLNLINSMSEAGCKKLIFASSSSVYGNKKYNYIAENYTLDPESIYGKSKKDCEELLKELCPKLGIDCVILRFFNVSGADLKVRIGEEHHPETHLIPKAIKYALSDNLKLPVYGSDYDTPDGTCLRDYIHVLDVCEACIKSVEFIQHTKGIYTFNIGSEVGTSVFQILTAIESLLLVPLNYDLLPRRMGDSSTLVSNSSLAKSTFAWAPKASDISVIVSSSYNWIKKKLNHQTSV